MYKALILVVASFALLATIISDSVKFTDCMENPSFITENVDLNPLVANPGINVTVTINGKSTSERKGGKLISSIFFKNVKMFEFKYDLCDVTKGGCPIVVGPWQGSVVQQVPKMAFIGSYTTKNQAFDLDGTTLLACVSFNFTVAKP